MKSNIAGVALAAVMACGWASGANAAIYQLSGGGDDNGNNDEWIVGYVNTQTASFSYRDTYVSCTDRPSCNGVPGPIKTVNVIQDVPYTITPFPDGPFYGFDFNGGGLKISYENFDNDPFSIAFPFYFSSNFQRSYGLHTDSTSFAFTPVDSVGSVPLPASAPMFGAAVLALAWAGYARHRSLSA